MKKILCMLAVMTGIITPMAAQEKADTSETKILISTPKRLYMGNGYDMLMFSSAYYDPGTSSEKITTPRFTAMVNLGLNFHYDVSKKAGFFTGIGLKNLGFIQKFKDATGAGITAKQRVYTLGIPLGVKLGDLRNRNFIFGGGGIDVPFHYSYKAFTKGERYNKYYKHSEWLSEEVASVMPYVFLGVSFNPGIIVKAQYYPSDFFNKDYGYRTSSGVMVQPYRSVKTHIFALCLSMDIHYNQYKIQEREYRKWKAGEIKN